MIRSKALQEPEGGVYSGRGCTFKSIIYSQAMRIKMICSEDEFVQQQLINLREKLELEHLELELFMIE